jgi:hypothetical protein
MTQNTDPPASLFEPRCKACRHPERGKIDLALARQEPYTRIAASFDLPYRSLANHRWKHLNFEEPDIAKVLAKERAIAQRNRELGVEVAIERRILLDRCIKTYFDLLSTGKIQVGKV